MVKINKLIEEFNLVPSTKFEDFDIIGVEAISSQSKNTLSWVKDESFLDSCKLGVFIVSMNTKINEDLNQVVFLKTEESPKLVFSKIVSIYFNKSHDYYLQNDVLLHRANKNLNISDQNVFIGQNVKIGNNSVIYPNVVIEADTIIGENCVLKPFTSVGTEGIGVHFDKERYYKFPQIGRAIIGNNVDIGPHTTVRRGALSNTIIGDGCKIGSFTNIGHNCILGKNIFITSGVNIAGSSSIGDRVFMGINSTVRNSKKIGENSVIGMGCVVLQNVPDNSKVIGNPGVIKPLRNPYNSFN